MIYTLILSAINLLSNSNISINIFRNDIEQGLEDEVDFHFNIPNYFSTQEQLYNLV